MRCPVPTATEQPYLTCTTWPTLFKLSSRRGADTAREIVWLIKQKQQRKLRCRKANPHFGASRLERPHLVLGGENADLQRHGHAREVGIAAVHVLQHPCECFRRIVLQRVLDGEHARLTVFVAIQQFVKHRGVHGKDQTVRLGEKRAVSFEVLL